jgi:hypothetical protein
MFGSSVLDLSLGLIFVFFLVSLVCSTVSDKISKLFSLRARYLEEWIRSLIMDGNQAMTDKLYRSPVIRALTPVGKKPEAIPARTLMLALFEAFVPNAAGKTTVGELQAHVAALPQGTPLKDTLLGFLTATDNKIEGLRTNFENWFDAAEAVMTREYRHRMWLCSLVIGFAVAAVLNVDTIAVARGLWRDSALRTSVAAAASTYAGKAAEAADPAGVKMNTGEAVRALEELKLPLGWPASPLSGKSWAQPGHKAGGGDIPLKLLGWLLTAFAGAQGAPFWFDTLRKLSQRG